MTTERVGESDVYARVVRNHAQARLSERWRVARRQRTAAAEAGRAVPGLDANLRQQDRAAQALKKRRHQMGALTLTTIEPRPVFEDDTLRDLADDAAQPRHGADRRPDDRVQRRRRALPRRITASRRCAASSACRRNGRASSTWPRSMAIGCRRIPTPSRSKNGCCAAARRIREHFPDLSLSVVKLLGRGEYVVEQPGEDADGALRPRGAGLHALDRAEPAVSGSRRAADRQGALDPTRPTRLTRPTAMAELDGDRRALHGTRRRRQQGRAAGPQGGCGAAAPIAHRRAVRRDRDRRIREGHVGAHPRAARRRPSRARLRRARRRRPRAREARAHRSGAWIHRFRCGVDCRALAEFITASVLCSPRLLTVVPGIPADVP